MFISIFLWTLKDFKKATGFLPTKKNRLLQSYSLNKALKL